MTNINDIFNDVPFDKFVELQTKYNQKHVTPIITKYLNILDHMFQTKPDNKKEWYKHESMRRLENYLKDTKQENNYRVPL